MKLKDVPMVFELPLNPKPFLRWAGGKRKLAPLIESIFPSNFNPSINKFYEPFVGGGAVSLYLGNSQLKNYIPGSQLVINDINPDLIITYKTVRDSLDELIILLKKYSKNLTKKDFEKMKKFKPKNNISRAARFIYLNKTCFNGLWRVNNKGEFNVPWGKLKNPKIFDSNELFQVSLRLKNALILNTNFTNTVKNCSKGDLVYFDPPYIPLSSSSSFSKYAKSDFTLTDHYALAGVIEGLTKKGVSVILSNSDTPETREIYGKLLNFNQINVQRSISASASSRISVKEILATNFASSEILKYRNLKAV